MAAIADQAITGLTPMDMAESVIYEVQPSVARFALARLLGPLYALPIPLGLIVGVLTAPLPLVLFFINVLRRYVVTSQRVLIQHTLTRDVLQSVKLAEVAQIRVTWQPGQQFYRAADLQLYDSGGSLILRLPGVPNPEAFRRRLAEAREALVQVHACLDKQQSSSGGDPSHS